MKQALEDYYRETEEKAERFTRAEEMRQRDDHLRAFHFGRVVQRIENSRRDTWRRFVWVLAGLAIGVAFGKVYPDHVYPALAQKYFSKVRLLVRRVGRAGNF